VGLARLRGRFIGETPIGFDHLDDLCTVTRRTDHEIDADPTNAPQEEGTAPFSRRIGPFRAGAKLACVT
jgi:hypothetical protein